MIHMTLHISDVYTAYQQVSWAFGYFDNGTWVFKTPALISLQPTVFLHSKLENLGLFWFKVLNFHEFSMRLQEGSPTNNEILLLQYPIELEGDQELRTSITLRSMNPLNSRENTFHSGFCVAWRWMSTNWFVRKFLPHFPLKVTIWMHFLGNQEIPT